MTYRPKDTDEGFCCVAWLLGLCVEDERCERQGEPGLSQFQNDSLSQQEGPLRPVPCLEGFALFLFRKLSLP